MLLLLMLSSITVKHNSCKSCIVNVSLMAHKVGADSTAYVQVGANIEIIVLISLTYCNNYVSSMQITDEVT